MKKIIKIQFFVLLVATIFGWSNFTIELFDWLNQKVCTTGCSISGEIKNPFLTPCFYGAIFFTLAFLLNLSMMVLYRRTKRLEQDGKEAKNATDNPATPSDNKF